MKSKSLRVFFFLFFNVSNNNNNSSNNWEVIWVSHQPHLLSGRPVPVACCSMHAQMFAQQTRVQNAALKKRPRLRAFWHILRRTHPHEALGSNRFPFNFSHLAVKGKVVISRALLSAAHIYWCSWDKKKKKNVVNVWLDGNHCLEQVLSFTARRRKPVPTAYHFFYHYAHNHI